MSDMVPCTCHYGDEPYCPRHTPLPGEPAAPSSQPCQECEALREKLAAAEKERDRALNAAEQAVERGNTAALLCKLAQDRAEAAKALAKRRAEALGEALLYIPVGCKAREIIEEALADGGQENPA